MLLWSGARCCTSTKAMFGSVSAGMPEKNASNAASPPADAPMPTMGKPDTLGATGSTGAACSSIGLLAGTGDSRAWATTGVGAAFAEVLVLFFMAGS